VSATPTDGAVEVTWTPVSSPNVAGYHVYRGPSSTGLFARLTTTPIPVTGQMRYRDTTAQPGHTYYYTVTAVNATGGESAYTTPVAVMIPTYQTPPLFEPFPWAVAGVTLGVILGALYGLAWRRKPA
jgi:fibronectin type 3 domain-containing protein